MKIHCCDYQSILKTLKDESIDLICIDPPYEINYKDAEWDKDELDWKFITKHFNRILKHTGNCIIFQGWSSVVKTINNIEIYSEGNLKLKNWIIWDRIKGRGASKNLISTREDILWFNKNPDFYTFNKSYSTIKKKTKGFGRKNGSQYRVLSNVWTDISPLVPWSKERIKHPTQKPVSLLKRIIRVFSNEKDMVFDCFCGSGTTGVAAKSLNRDFIISDNNDEYIKITKERIKRGY